MSATPPSWQVDPTGEHTIMFSDGWWIAAAPDSVDWWNATLYGPSGEEQTLIGGTEAETIAEITEIAKRHDS